MCFQRINAFTQSRYSLWQEMSQVQKKKICQKRYKSDALKNLVIKKSILIYGLLIKAYGNTLLWNSKMLKIKCIGILHSAI